jgi:galactose mutarotase-like enzyme
MSYKTEFGTVDCYKLTNANGCEVEIINYGAYIRSFKVAGKDSRGPVDIVLGYDSLAGVWTGP